MTHQVPYTVRARIRPEMETSLRDLLHEMGKDPARNSVMPFAGMEGVHFARFVILDEVKDLEGAVIPASLVFASNVDAPLGDHVDQLVSELGDGLDRVFSHCEAYPEPNARTPESRRAYLRTHTIPVQGYYVNTLGRPVRQIREEARLRDEVQVFLDDYLPAHTGNGLSSETVSRDLRTHVGSRENLKWALSPAKKPPLWWRAKEKLTFVLVVLGLLLLLPVTIVLVPVWLLIIRRKEKQSTWDVDYRLSEQYREDLTSLEDHVVHNQFSAVGFIKPGWIRLTTIRVLLWLVKFSARHIFNRGNLAGVDLLGLDGVDTIHFARWVILDEGRRVLFLSNYDGSLESYMDDFINKVAWGLNLVFSNGVGYPKTRWLILDGARDEQQFKAFLRHHQIPTQVWYSAYERQSAVNNTNNALIRAGFSKAANGRESEAWLSRL